MIFRLMRLLGIAAILCWMGLGHVASARVTTGWTKGQRTRIKLVWVAGVELEERTASAFRAMASAARKRGIVLGIRSGFRSQDEQRELYRQFRRGWGNLAARPGYSNHQSGKALDIDIEDYDVFEWLRGNAGRFGFKRTVRREAWHWEYVGGGQPVAGKKRLARRRA